jgi:hypothetical protein
MPDAGSRLRAPLCRRQLPLKGAALKGSISMGDERAICTEPPANASPSSPLRGIYCLIGAAR